MPVLSDLEGGVLDRLEESRTAPSFWDVQEEIRMYLAEAMCEAVLLSGEPERRAPQAYELAKDTTLFPVPADAVSVVRMEAIGSPLLRRCSVWDLDKNVPGWQTHTGEKVKYWFPFGMTMFGIYPKLKDNVNVVLTYVQLPVSVAPPLDGTQEVPFQAEYLDGFEDYAAHVARLKEGGAEFGESMQQYNAYLKKMQELGKFSQRKGIIRFTRRGGIPATTTEVTVR